jgi:hypothetical protein
MIAQTLRDKYALRYGPGALGVRDRDAETSMLSEQFQLFKE